MIQAKRFVVLRRGVPQRASTLSGLEFVEVTKSFSKEELVYETAPGAAKLGFSFRGKEWSVAMGAGDLVHGLVTATREIGVCCFDCGFFGGVEAGEGIMESPHHDESGHDGESTLKLVKAEGGHPLPES